MRHKTPADVDTISDEEFADLLADAEGTTPEEIERGAAELNIAPPEEATVVDVNETDDQEATDATQSEQSSQSMPEMLRVHRHKWTAHPDTVCAAQHADENEEYDVNPEE